MRPTSSIQWKAYPAGLMAGCVAVGIVLADHVGGRPLLWAMGGTAVLLIASGVLYGMRKRLVSLAPLLATGCVALALIAVGAARQASFTTLPAQHIGHVVAPITADSTIAGSLQGRVADHPVDQPRQLRLTVEVDTWQPLTGVPRRTTGRLQATLWAPWGDTLRAPSVVHGDRVTLHGALGGLPRRRNPADFDYGAFLERQGIRAVFTVRDSAAVVVEGAARSRLDALIVHLRSYVRHHLEAAIPSAEGRTLLTALVLGDRSALDPDTREQFRRTGLMHLLAVSGLHVLLVGMVLFQLLGPILRRLRLPWQAAEGGRAMLTLLLLGLYMLVAGASVSVVRAVLMAALLIGGLLLQRSAHTLNTLGVAALVLLLVRPTQLFDVGFQLSFAAVGAIVTLQPRLRDAVPEWWLAHPWGRAATLNVVVSLGAVLGTLPVLLYHFGYASWAGLVLNLAAIPLTAGTLLAGLLSLTLGGLSDLLGHAFGASADTFAQALLWLTAVGDSYLAVFSVERFVTAPLTVIALTMSLLAVAQWPRPRNRWCLLLAGLACLALAAWRPIVQQNASPTLEIVFFDVGHGDAALVKLPDGGTLLVDAGVRTDLVDQGRRTILPHLHRFGIRRIDTVVISHPHADHFGGLPTLLRSFPVGRVLHNGQSYPSGLFEEKMAVLDSLGIPHQAVSTGDTLFLDPSVHVAVLAPERNHSFGAEQANDASVVLRLQYGRHRVLFTGDAEEDAERLMVARYGRMLRSDVVKVGHHGSRTSSTRSFVEAVAGDPDEILKAVVSVGRGQRYGLPNSEVLDRWKEQGGIVKKTPARGAIWLRVDADTIMAHEWRR